MVSVRPIRSRPIAIDRNNPCWLLVGIRLGRERKGLCRETGTDVQVELKPEIHLQMQAWMQMEPEEDMEMKTAIIRNEDVQPGSGYAYGNYFTSTSERSHQDRGLRLNRDLKRC